MSARIPPIDESRADAETRETLALIRREWGSSWNITNAMATNPAVVAGFFALWQAIERSGLTSTDREVICMEMAVQNGCHYCVPAHRYVAREAGIDADLIDRIARGETLDGDDRPAVLQRLVRALLATKGQLSDQDFAGFREAGITEAQMIAVVAEIAHCTLTNTFNRLADTELDPFLQPLRLD